MANKVTPRTLSGFMELLPQDQMKFDRIVNTLEDVYASYGFLPLDTPILEASEVLLAKAGGETEKQIYRFNKGDTDLAMRFDLTVPLAKFVAKNYSSLTFPFKRYQIGKVYRGERAQKGRFREFYQADIDIIGDTSLGIMNDAELPSIIYNIFTDLGLDDFTIRMNNRKVLSGFFEILDLSDHVADILRVVDKLEKIGSAAVIEELKTLGVSEEKCSEIIRFISISGSNEAVVAQLRNYAGQSEVFDTGVDELEAVTKGVSAFGVPEKNYKIDLCIARGLDYYTGTVYETTFNRHPEIGSICSGGRYDNLASQGNRKYPGVGLSIGLSRLVSYMLHSAGAHASRVCPASVLVAVWNEQDRSAANLIANTLRSRGIAADVAPTAAKLGKQIKYADKLGIPYVWFPAGATDGDDTASDEVKNIVTGDQQPADPKSWQPDTVYARQTVVID